MAKKSGGSVVWSLAVPVALRAGVEVALDDVRAAGRVTGTLAIETAEVESVVARDTELVPAEPKPVNFNI